MVNPGKIPNDSSKKKYSHDFEVGRPGTELSEIDRN